MKVTLGTVQFGIQYGISNTHGVPSDSELKSIFSVANELGIQHLDTAKAYGTAEERIGKWSDNKFKIITKFPKVDSNEMLEEALSESLLKLKVDSIYGYLAHNADVLIEHPELWKTLLEAKRLGKVKKIGYSLYTPEQLETLLEMNCVPDLVQLPYSILDRKFEEQLQVLKEIGVEVHVRSVFLQGLYFLNPNQLPEKLQPLQSSLLELNDLCIQNNVSVAAATINYVISNPNIDQLVIGVETATQLRENIELITSWKSNPELFSRVEAIKIKDKSLLNPVNW